MATVASTAVDRVARRLLPLTVLLRMTMLFPDAAPSRLRTARRAGNVSELRRRILAADSDDGDTDLAEMAELVLALSAALSNHDRRTRGHSERTRAYTDMIAEEMEIAPDDRDRLRWAALLHDVGKLEVPTEILNKDSKLTDEEWHIVQQHPINGMKLVGPLIPWLGEWAKTIEHHHERFDGTGYPHGLAGTEISLGARIVSVADAYDVMTSGRSYQHAKSPSEARHEIARNAGRQFDPVVARALMNVSLGRLRWSTGPLAVLAEIPFIRGLPQVGRDMAMVMATSAVMTSGFVTGVIPSPDGIEVTPRELVEVVIAGAGLSRESDDTSTDTDGLPLAAGSGTTGTDTPDAGDAPPVTTTTAEVTTSTTAPAPNTTPPTTAPTGGAPVARDDAGSTQEDVAVSIGVLGNDSDPDGDLAPSTLAVVGNGSRGTASVSGGAIRYTPGPDLNGTDTISYRICDAIGLCDTATVSITVVPVNDPPIAPARSATTDEGVLVAMGLGYSDADGDVLSCTLAAAPAVGAATVPGDCSTVRYSPPASFDGVVTLGVDVTDGTVTVRGIVTITVVGTNQAPVAVDDSASTSGGAISIPVLANDSDPDGDALAISSVSSASSGTATRSGSTVTFSPSPGFSGTATFGYSVCDPGGLCDTATVSVAVTAASPIEANDDSASTKRNGTVNVTVLSNDTGPVDPQSVTVGSATGGTASTLGGSGRVKFTAAPGFAGVATFTYSVCDSSGSCDSASVRVEVG